MISGLTICIPVFNESRYIQRAIESAVDQCETILVSDNASDDGTYEICVEMASKYENIRLYRNDKNIGALKNWRKLAREVQSPYMMFLGAHDYLEEAYAAKCLEKMEEDDSNQICMGELWKSNEQGDIEIDQRFAAWKGVGDDKCSRLRAFFYTKSPVFWLAYGIYRTETFQEMFFKELPVYGMDTFFIANVLMRGKANIVRGAKYFAHIRGGSCAVEDTIERMLGERGGASAKSILQDYKLLKFECVCEGCAGKCLRTVERFRSMVWFGTFRSSGKDYVYYLLYIPVKLARRVRRLILKFSGL